MAIRVTRSTRPLIVAAALVTGALVAPAIAAATPGRPHQQPTIASVQHQLSALAKTNSQVVEQYNQARVLVAKREKQAAAASRTADRAAATFRRASVEFSQVVQAQYESGASLGAAGALLDSSNGNNYLDRLDTLNLISTHDAEVVSLMTRSKATSAQAAARAQKLLAGARTERDGLAAKKASVRKQIAKYQSLLATLTAAQQAAFQRAQNPTVAAAPTAKSVTFTGATSAGAKRAVEFALAQVGKPYVFGAAGPGAYDCSGLTMAAWRAGGVSLPHSAADQYNYGHHVDRSQLQPGDLIFFYQPIGHVTIYIGNGQMVSAPTEGQPVSVVPLSYFNSDYVGATRLT